MEDKSEKIKHVKEKSNRKSKTIYSLYKQLSTLMLLKNLNCYTVFNNSQDIKFSHPI